MKSERCIIEVQLAATDGNLILYDVANLLSVYETYLWQIVDHLNKMAITRCSQGSWNQSMMHVSLDFRNHEAFTRNNGYMNFGRWGNNVSGPV